MKKKKMPFPFLSIGLILLLLGVIFIIISAFTGAGRDNVKVGGGFGGFIGPIPFGFFSSPGMFWIWLVIMLALLLIWFIFFRLRGF